jgi:threonine/homoserine/homoserine lactone efflux protein
MIAVDHLDLFFVSGVLLNLTPGPDVLFIVSQALRGGVRPGIVAALGIVCGCLVHVAGAAMGLGALLAASTTAFDALKWAGAAYLVWTGIRWLGRTASPPMTGWVEVGPPGQATVWREVFWRGFATNVLNPKVALFFLAFVPQFISPNASDPTLTFVLLGLLFNFNALLVCVAWALAAAWLASHVARVQQALSWLDRVAGVLFLGFGLKLALSDAPVH